MGRVAEVHDRVGTGRLTGCEPSTHASLEDSLRLELLRVVQVHHVFAALTGALYYHDFMHV